MMFFKSEDIKKIIESLDDQINQLDKIYKDMEDKLKALDGTEELWQGDAQANLYDYVSLIEKDFPISIENFRKYKIFLQVTLDKYVLKENDINQSIDNEKEDLDINQ